LELPPPPEGEESAPLILARVNSVFSARYVPDEGFLGVRAHIGTGSFVYTPDCHLQGDFAFYSWFKGEHNGDFVYTMGGYHPHFKPPAHYPQRAELQPLGFQWDVDSHLSVKGGLYYALTPSAAMAGGHLEASFHSGALEAWFNLGLDLLIQWQPYHYEAQAHVEIGASVTIDPPIIGTIRITIEAGAELELWGPEFSGRAHVHVSVMGVSVGFSVEFIETSEGEPLALTWPQFSAAFLPEPEKVVTVSVTGGLLRTLKDDGHDRYVVNPKELALVTSALIPSSRLAGPQDSHIDGDPRARVPFGIAPMHLATTDVTQTVTVKRNDQPGFENDFRYAPVVKRFPAALWGNKYKPADVINAGSIKAWGGWEVRPATPAKPGASSRIERAHLDYEVTPRFLPGEAVAAHEYTLDPDSAGGLSDALASTTGARAQALDVLGFDVSAEIDLSDSVADTFIEPVQLVTWRDA
jgi:hypothetical protein